MLARRFIFVCLFGLGAVGCTTTDKQATQLTAQAKAPETVPKKPVGKIKSKAQAQQDQAPTPELLAFAAPDSGTPDSGTTQIREYHLPHATEETQQLIKIYAEAYDVPERLVRRVVRRESHGNPKARNGPYWGLMQISYPTAQGMGYQGKPEGLLDAETNLKYAVKYLAGAYIVADGDETQAVRLYARGFYYDAKAKGLLERTGLRPGPSSILTAFADE